MLDQSLILLTYMLVFTTALMLVALGGMFSERSGVINIGLEGIMIIGGFCGLLALRGMMAANLPPALVVILTILVAVASGMAYSLLLAFATINLKADQTLIGTALNLLASAISVTFIKKISGATATTIQYSKEYFVYSFGNFSISIFFFLGIVILAVAVFALYKTRFGLRLRACGENPQAADSLGINIKKYRYAGVLISGALGGLGAIAYILPTQSFWNSSDGVAGFGFLALAIMIFGAWKPLKISIVSLIFSFFLSLSYVYSGIFLAFFGINLTAENGVTSELFKMIPFVASLLLLIFTSKNSRAPKAEGIPYDASRR